LLGVNRQFELYSTLRVLHVYRTFFPDSQGGLEETIKQICLSTRAANVESRVFSLSRSATTEPALVDGIEVFRGALDFELASCSMSLRSLALFRRLYTWADIVHYHFPWPFGDVLHLLQDGSKPSVVTYHSDIVRQRTLRWLYSPIMHRFLGSVDRIVCTSPNYFATSDILLRYQSKVRVIPIGLDSASYPCATEQQLRLVDQTYGENFFLFIGVLRYYKGLHILLDALVDAPYRVVIVGSGPTEMSLKRQAKALGLSNVVFAGSIDNEEKVALLNRCKGIVFPSYLRSEAFGVTLLEGAMYGRPLISAEVGSGTSHINLHNETGLVIAPGSKRALRHALDELHRDPESSSAMGRRARTRFEELFTGEIMGKRYASMYADVLEVSPSKPAIQNVEVSDAM